MLTWTYAWLVKMWAFLIDTAAPLETAELRLTTAPVETENEAVAADLIAPTYTGYAVGAITAWVPGVTENGLPYIAFPPFVFMPTNGAALPQIIYGAGIVDVDDELVAFCNFEEPLTLALANQQIHVTAKLYFNGTMSVELENYAG